MNPKITAIIPTYQRSKFLKNAIKSVLDQTYSDLLVLVCDNNSSDDTQEIVRSLAQNDPRIQYFRQPEHVSLLENFEKGLSLSTTPYYSILCDDDFLLPWFYEDAIRALEQDPEAIMFAGGTLIVDEHQKIIRKDQIAHDGKWDIKTCSNNQMKSVAMKLVLPSCVFRKGEHENTPRIHPKGPWDQTMIWNVLINYPIVTTKKYVVGYRKHPKQDSLNETNQYSYRNEEKFENSIRKHDPEIIKKIRLSDNVEEMWKTFVILILNNQNRLAKFYYETIKSEKKTLALALCIFRNICKIQTIRKNLLKLVNFYMKKKKFERQSNQNNDEFKDLINRYTFPIYPS